MCAAAMLHVVLPEREAEHAAARRQGVDLTRRIGLVWRRDLDPVIGEAAQAPDLRFR